MEAISRGLGVTESERYLAKLADKSFLRLWSYPNTFISKKQNAQGAGKELADLLVVCGNDILIFSDKAVEWPEGKDIDIAWARWYRRAISKSVDQIRGAERWIANFPERIFLDGECKRPFPIDFPPVAQRKVHGIIVATGASTAVQEIYADDSGTFPLSGLTKGKDHVTPSAKGYMPLFIGDVDPEGRFVHVFDPNGLDVVMEELDTIHDFAEYLQKRAEFFRSGRFAVAAGEEELLASYLQNSTDDESHSFIPTGIPASLDDHLIQIPGGEYAAFIKSKPYRARKEANKPSYNWDKLIDVFVDHVLAGTSVPLLDHAPNARLAERGLRLMALENRVHRRLLGTSIVEALDKARRTGADRFVRTMLPGVYSPNRRVAYILLVLAYPKDFALEKGYDDYRTARASMLQMYCLNLFDQNAEIDFVVGIGVDASEEVSGRPGGSEDLVSMERPEWTEDLRTKMKSAREALNIKSLEALNPVRVETSEYPTTKYPLSRQQRRAQERAERKAARRIVSARS